MYKNPLNNGDLSDYNILKNQRNYSEIIKEYQSRKLKTEPTELLKYYEFLTYKQSVLDELNYVAERIKRENIKKQKEDYEFIRELKDKREQILKPPNQDKKIEIKKDLFDDMTPTINTDLELENTSVAGATEGDFELKRKDKLSKPEMISIIKAELGDTVNKKKLKSKNKSQLEDEYAYLFEPSYERIKKPLEIEEPTPIKKGRGRPPKFSTGESQILTREELQRRKMVSEYKSNLI
jgi:hypothetical protein